MASVSPRSLARPELSRPGRPSLRSLDPPKRRRPPDLRRAVALSVALALGSVLVVVAANAYLTQGQFRLTHLQTQIDAQASRRLQLELEVAQLQSPARIVGQALQQGLGAPTKVSTLPLVTVPSHSAKAGSDHSTSPTGDAGVAGAHRPASPTTGKPSSATPSAPSSSPGR